MPLKTTKNRFQLLSKTLFYFCSLFFGCTNSRMPSLILPAVTTNPSSSPTASTALNLIISSLTISSPSSSSSSNLPSSSSSHAASPSTATLFFNTTLSQTNINSFCSLNSPTPCYCQFSWTEINTQTGSSVPVSHQVQTPLLTIQSELVTCNLPDLYSTEIPDSTQVNITVVQPSNQGANSGLQVSIYSILKGGSSTGGTFQDIEGNSYDNILHYSCFQGFTRHMSIQSKMQSVPNPSASSTGPSAVNVVIASQFNPTNQDISAQSYYFNLYVRESERGDINLFNNNYTCPTVQEPLSQNTGVSSSNQPWPLDQTFALSISPTPTLHVGVDAITKLSNGNDPTAQNSTCAGSTTSTSSSSTSNNSLVSSCLGYAAPPNSDGTCPLLRNRSNQFQPTFRLRRFNAIYPRLFDARGAPLPNQAVDQIYVLDRPVINPPNANPLVSYTMLGPKPCPFSFYDRKGVVATSLSSPPLYTAPGYYGTNNSHWTNTNVDGIEFPNVDGYAPDGSPSCSAAMPVFDLNSNLGITTVNLFSTLTGNHQSNTHVYIRPIQPFVPHYEEDTLFQACAPQALPLVDPPLHFARVPATRAFDSSHIGNVAWCSESYPTQNSNLSVIDPPRVSPAPLASWGILTTGTASGLISPFTSHTVRNTASAACSATLLSSSATTSNTNYTYPSYPTGMAWHQTPNWDYPNSSSATCDRTVLANNFGFARFPLLSTATEVELAITLDKSYLCTLTYDASGTKTNVATPSDGCCASSSVQIRTGSAIGAGAHLEPDIPCKIPNY